MNRLRPYSTAKASSLICRDTPNTSFPLRDNVFHIIIVGLLFRILPDRHNPRVNFELEILQDDSAAEKEEVGVDVLTDL